MATAIATLDPKLVRLAHALELSWYARVRKIVLPALLPTLPIALRIGFGSTFLGLALAEMFSADVGLGASLSTTSPTCASDRSRAR